MGTAQYPQDLVTYSLSEVAAEICGDSMLHPERWLTTKIKAGVFPARKIGRSWRMTRDDINAALDALSSKPVVAEDKPDSEVGLSAGSRRRLSSVPR